MLAFANPLNAHIILHIKTLDLHFSLTDLNILSGETPSTGTRAKRGQWRQDKLSVVIAKSSCTQMETIHICNQCLSENTQLTCHPVSP